MKTCVADTKQANPAEDKFAKVKVKNAKFNAHIWSNKYASTLLKICGWDIKIIQLVRCYATGVAPLQNCHTVCTTAPTIPSSAGLRVVADLCNERVYAFWLHRISCKAFESDFYSPLRCGYCWCAAPHALQELLVWLPEKVRVAGAANMIRLTEDILRYDPSMCKPQTALESKCRRSVFRFLYHCTTRPIAEPAVEYVATLFIWLGTYSRSDGPCLLGLVNHVVRSAAAECMLARYLLLPSHAE